MLETREPNLNSHPEKLKNHLLRPISLPFQRFILI